MLSRYSSDAAKVNRMVEQLDEIGFRQKALIAFLSKEEIRAKIIFVKLKAAYGEQTLSYRSDRRCVNSSVPNYRLQ